MRWKRRDLSERLSPYMRKLALGKDSISTDPVRMFLFRWMIETGDPIDVIARGFDLPEDLVRQILRRDIAEFSEDQDRIVRQKLRLR